MLMDYEYQVLQYVVFLTFNDIKQVAYNKRDIADNN